jgi:hypothetical protein
MGFWLEGGRDAAQAHRRKGAIPRLEPRLS